MGAANVARSRLGRSLIHRQTVSDDKKVLLKKYSRKEGSSDSPVYRTEKGREEWEAGGQVEEDRRGHR